MRKKILYTTADCSPQSGAFRHLLFMAKTVQMNGLEPLMILHDEAKDSNLLEGIDFGQLIFMDLPRAKRGQSLAYYWNYLIKNISCIFRTIKIIHAQNIDIVHVNEILDFYGGVASWLAGVPCVWHVRADLANTPNLGCIFTRIVLLLAKRIIVVSGSVKDRMFAGMGNKKVVVLHDPGPDPDTFNQQVEGARIRKEFNIPQNGYLVSMVGKIQELKGQHILVNAIPDVLRRFPETIFLFVGAELPDEHHQKYNARLKKNVRKLAVQDHVVFTGFRSDIPEIMSGSDIVTHCSIYPDPFPGVVLQGMSVGTPVVASDLGGPREQIEHGVSGMLVEAENPHILADTICDLLANESDRMKIGDNAAERIINEYTTQSFLNRLREIYQEVL